MVDNWKATRDFRIFDAGERDDGVLRGEIRTDDGVIPFDLSGLLPGPRGSAPCGWGRSAVWTSI